MPNYIIFSEHCRSVIFVTLQRNLLRICQNIPEHLDYGLSFKTVNDSTRSIYAITIRFSSVGWLGNNTSRVIPVQFCWLL